MKNICFFITILLTIITTLAAADELEMLKSKADKYWQHRDIQETLLKCIDTYEKALSLSPKDELILSRLSIAHFWKGNNMSDGMWYRKQRMKAYETGREYAAKLCEFNPESIEGNFWHATNDAAYIDEVIVKTSKSVIDDAKRRNAFVMTHDQFYYHGGPQRLGAKIILGIPDFVRAEDESLQIAEKYLKDAISNYPNFTLSHIFLSDLYMKLGQKDLAQKTLKHVLTIDENSVPQFAPENRRDKNEASLRLKNNF